ncbi:MAG: M3 family metallopeptidase [Steroidobacteraceae bacterium]|nr:M3 family metallopeptidase [Steroidobacteraceae bacterium]
MKSLLLAGAVALALSATAPAPASAAEAAKPSAAADQQTENPFFQAWTTPFGAVPFDRIRDEHFRPAYERAFAAHRAEIAAIANSPEPPTFANTIDALERAGELLERVGSVFGKLTASHTNDTLQAIQREIAPVSARHQSEIALNAALFRRIDTLWQRRDELDLTAEQRRVLERYHLSFVRAGARLDEAAKTRMREINERLATLQTTFGQNVLADETDWMLVLEKPEDLAGLPDFVVTAAAQAATERGHDGKHVITLSRSLVEPFLTQSERRDLREKVYRAFVSRGDNGSAHDNKAVVAEIVALRAERAQLLGYPSFADFSIADTMATTPAQALDLLRRVWEPARAKALADRDALQALVKAEGRDYALAPWDWRYYEEKLRRAKYDFDDDALKPYLQLDRIVEAQFYVANRLFGLTFHERRDIPVYHPDVRVWEVQDRDGRHVGLFYGDYFSRQTKRSGAWMSALRPQRGLDAWVHPHITNDCNYNEPTAGKPALLSFRDAEVVFHEFGHALHGLLSKVTYPRLAGTATDRDFVEFPAQIYEHFLSQPQVLQKFAVHYETGAPMPRELLDKLMAARNFRQGFDTVEFIATAFVDLEFHALDLQRARTVDTGAFERQVLERIGMPAEIAMRHRTKHLQHAFAGEGYAAGYYTYLWAGVLDTDAFAAFREAGDPFHPELARRLYEYVYSAGNLRPPMEAYVKFRGREPQVEALLRHRGFPTAGTSN